MAAKDKSIFDSKTCDRCGGSGEHSFCETAGRVCFKCGGAGYVLTAKGKKAADYLTRLLSKPAKELKPGDRYRSSGRWIVIDNVRSGPNTCLINGRPEEGTFYFIDGHYAKGGGQISDGGYAPDNLLRVFHTAEEKAPKIAAALAYQATL